MLNYPHRPLAMTEAQWEDAKARYLAGESSEDIALAIGCKRGTLDVRLHRAGLPKLREAKRKEGRGDRTKGKFAQISENIADQLLQKTPKGLVSLNLHADTAQKGAKIAALVHGWGDGAQIAIIVAGDIEGRAELEAIEVESATERQQTDHK